MPEDSPGLSDSLSISYNIRVTEYTESLFLGKRIHSDTYFRVGLLDLLLSHLPFYFTFSTAHNAYKITKLWFYGKP